MTTSTMSLPKEEIRTKVDVTLGMIFFIGSWTMSFGTLFLSFLVLRQRVGVWPPEGIALPSFNLASVATLILIGSSVALHRAVREWNPTDSDRAAADPRSGIGANWFIGIVLGFAFAIMQWALWSNLTAAGRLPSSGLYESLFYGLTWIHALHVVIGLCSLIWAWIGLSRGRYGPHRLSTVSNIVIFWHFVDVVWIVLYLGFFVF
ncbi:MAG: heme/copper-type cytochrome/quinol oxidase subunit 3 [Planctomycetota bacterium]|jgi:heme/copper-type cytochrome/quinol oxidase subunit 3